MNVIRVNLIPYVDKFSRGFIFANADLEKIRVDLFSRRVEYKVFRVDLFSRRPYQSFFFNSKMKINSSFEFKHAVGIRKAFGADTSEHLKSHVSIKNIIVRPVITVIVGIMII